MPGTTSKRPWIALSFAWRQRLGFTVSGQPVQPSCAVSMKEKVPMSQTGWPAAFSTFASGMVPMKPLRASAKSSGVSGGSAARKDS